jgi:hypothetical protein
MNNCIPTGAPPAVDDPCAMLPQLRAALYGLMSGQARAQVRNGDQWLTWHQGNVKELKSEVRRLEIICGTNSNVGRAVRVGPYYSANSPYHRNRY